MAKQELAAVLRNLQPLSKGQYFTAFGPDGRFFFGTPNGYAAKGLPTEIIQRILSGSVRKVVYASFSDHPEVWFVAYEAISGPSYELGDASPPVLDRYVSSLLVPKQLPNQPMPFVRVQFGASHSFIAWSKRSWMYHNVPTSVQRFLKHQSHNEKTKPCRGNFNTDCPFTIAFHHDGSFFALGTKFLPKHATRMNRYHVYNLVQDEPLDLGLRRLCQKQTYTHLDLHFAIDPFRPCADNYVVIKAQNFGQDDDFMVCLAPQTPVFRVSPLDTSIQMNKAPKTYQWAVVTRRGRPHPADTWELILDPGSRVKVIDDLGKEWFHAEARDGRIGYVHKSWLKFDKEKDLGSKPHGAYHDFKIETTQFFLSPLGSARAFPNIVQHLRQTKTCENEACKHVKQTVDGLGICHHDLERLLRGADTYSYAFLKDERNKWHPDKFARLCHPNHREELTKKAECVFVFVGLLMDMLSAESNA
ncbi:hypothetical protein B0J11DRAFT_430713 [Dendryphion nanum]|uniref:SH3 domain-containing protein n=1 Tax=Dendryphion nanum TaxID=256645 RepID=A0A9P9E598_9PLEO|nr:hypothetical protein B0J11DRAFT_430713 [Dendryphion nanum]